MNLGLAILMKDGYKAFHPYAYKPGYTEIVSNFTPRSNKHSNVESSKGVIHIGTQFFIKEVLIRMFNEQFFNIPKQEVISEYKRVMEAYLLHEVKTEIFENLHDLGYLPLEIRSLPEGSFIPYQVPVLTIRNTHPNFGWLPNMLETILSTYIWPMMTSATTAYNYFKEAKLALKKTGMSEDGLPFMCHDFSFRGMFGLEAAAISGFGHLTSFSGTDTIPAILFAEKYYNADASKEIVGCSVNATEHSVTSSWGRDGELEFINHLLDTASPTGILAIVSDTYDFWDLVTQKLPMLKDKIMSRDGKVVIRPDSGDPVKILTGYTYEEIASVNVLYDLYDYTLSNIPECAKIGNNFYKISHPSIDGRISIGGYIEEYEVKGLIEVLYEIFGGVVNEAGFKMLDSHIGAIYGDSITLERQKEIYQRLSDKGFSPDVVLGVGSYSYQMVTRDTHGSAMKATNVMFGDKDVPIFKDPKTDKSKKSAKGLIKVTKENGVYKANDCQTRESWNDKDNCLEVVYLDGKILKETSLKEIRKLVHSQT